MGDTEQTVVEVRDARREDMYEVAAMIQVAVVFCLSFS